MEALFSIIVPIYKVEEYLPQCIESVLQQTFPDFELILVDDGSPDRCGEICEEYAQNDARIKVLHKENGGLVSARKAGLRLSTHDYIVNVDSDDYVDSKLLANLSDVIKKHNPDVIAYDCAKVSEEGTFLASLRNNSEEGLYTEQKLEELKEKLIYDKTIKHTNSGSLIYSIWSKVFKKECIEKAQYNVPEKIVMGEDLAATIPAICNCRSLYVLKYCGYMYRQRNTSMVHAFDEKEISRYQILLNHLGEEVPELDRESVHLYCYKNTLGYILKAARYTSRYQQFKNILDTKKDELCMRECINLNPKNLGWKDRMRWFSMKHHLWWAFWLQYK